MPKLTTLNITKEQRERLEDVRGFIEKQYGTNASLSDCVGHLIRFWNQNRGNKSGPAPQNSEKEE